MTEYIRIISDGSFAPLTGKIGAGYVRLNDDNTVAFAKTKKLKSSHIEFIKHGSNISELFAAMIALNSLPEGASVKLYSDSQFTVDLINNFSTMDRDNFIFPKFYDLLNDILSKLINVIPVLRASNACDIPSYLFAIAHNASAEASGSGKREVTGSYDGQFASAFDRRIRNPNPEYNNRKLNVKTPFNGMEIIDTQRQFPTGDPRHPDFKY